MGNYWCSSLLQSAASFDFMDQFRPISSTNNYQVIRTLSVIEGCHFSPVSVAYSTAVYFILLLSFRFLKEMPVRILPFPCYGFMPVISAFLTYIKLNLWLTAYLLKSFLPVSFSIGCFTLLYEAKNTDKDHFLLQSQRRNWDLWRPQS